MLHTNCTVSRKLQPDFCNEWYEDLMYQKWPYQVLGTGKFVYF